MGDVNTMNIPTILILVGAILSAIGAFWASYMENQALTRAANERARFEKELRSKSEEISELNKTIAATITGGDSYCRLRISPPDSNSNTSDMTLWHEGKYPLYDVSIRIDDAEKLVNILNEEVRKGNIPAKSLNQALSLLLPSSQVRSIGNFGPNQILPMGSLDLGHGDKRSYNVYITMRNGSVFQAVRFRKTDGKWKIAIRSIWNDKIVEEKIDPDFPKETDGTIKW